MKCLTLKTETARSTEAETRVAEDLHLLIPRGARAP